MYYQSQRIITFVSADREMWLRTISELYKNVSSLVLKQEMFVLDFDSSIDVESLKPFHLVTVANIIHLIIGSGMQVSIRNTNQEVFNYIYNELSFYKYWSKGKNYVEAKTSRNVFNLWRIVESEKDLYAKKVEDYFKKRYFQNKDLSAISVSLVEAYYNVFDHAMANGNAFSLIQYEEESSKLFVAISDFGKGISKTVRDYNTNINSDHEAILKAIEDRFTVQSTVRNKGFGLSIILAPTEEARIFSGNGLVYKNTDGDILGYETDFSYPGTLIYYEIDLSKMESEELLEEFTL